MSRDKTLKYILNQTDMLERLLGQLSKLYYTDIIEQRTEHIMFDQSIYKEGVYNVDLYITKIFKTYLKAVDFTDVPRNKKLMQCFIQLFNDINERMPSESSKEAFFAVPLHRAFSYYLNRLILQNYLKEAPTNSKKPKELFLDIFRRFVEFPTNLHVWKYLQNVIETILKPISHSWAFIHEILAGRWVFCGLYI